MACWSGMVKLEARVKRLGVTDRSKPYFERVFLNVIAFPGLLSALKLSCTLFDIIRGLIVEILSFMEKTALVIPTLFPQ